MWQTGGLYFAVKFFMYSDVKTTKQRPSCALQSQICCSAYVVRWKKRAEDNIKKTFSPVDLDFHSSRTNRRVDLLSPVHHTNLKLQFVRIKHYNQNTNWIPTTVWHCWIMYPRGIHAVIHHCLLHKNVSRVVYFLLLNTR